MKKENIDMESLANPKKLTMVKYFLKTETFHDFSRIIT